MNDLKKLKSLTESLVVLFVEDDYDLRIKTIPIFKRFFKRVDMATNGQEGLEAYESYKHETNGCYDIVISDIQMPKMDGIQLSKALFRINPSQQIIITSAYNDKEYLIDLINIGVAGFYQKPINDEEMFGVLHDVCLNIVGKSLIVLGEDYAYDTMRKSLFKGNEMLELSKQEQDLLDLLCSNLDQYFSALDIFNHIYYDQVEKEYSNDAIKSLIKRLRKKLPDDLIVNTPSLGYCIKSLH